MFLDSQTLEILQRVLLAVILGGAIGVERELAHKMAGMRTHALVSLGAALYSIISAGFSAPGADPTRIAAQIVTGIGFLGAGIIIFQGTKVQGVTTAAGVWVAAAIGMASGFGFYKLAISAAVLTILIFLILWPLELFLKRFRKDKDIDLD